LSSGRPLLDRFCRFSFLGAEIGPRGTASPRGPQPAGIHERYRELIASKSFIPKAIREEQAGDFSLEMIDQTGQISCAKAVIDIHHGYPSGT
jgi:hypothetical protein